MGSNNIVGKIIDYEDGTLGDAETLDLFAELIASGMAWQLQGSYGRAAASMIEAGYITPEGELTELAEEFSHA